MLLYLKFVRIMYSFLLAEVIKSSKIRRTNYVKVNSIDGNRILVAILMPSGSLSTKQ